MPTKTKAKSRRAVGIVRVSHVGGREGESFASPDLQRERIEQAAERDGLKLLRVHEELDVSGRTALEKRKGLRAAIEAVEAGEADVIVAAYFDRLCRSLKVQAELVERVEAAGGQVLTVDVGQVTNGSASQWLSATMLGAVAEYQARVSGERVEGARARAVKRGVCPFRTPPGYRRGDDGVLMVEPAEAKTMKQAFKMRANGASISDVRDHIRAHGIERTHSGTAKLLRSRVYLGECKFGELSTPEAHPAIIDAETFRRVQKMKIPGGRRAKSEQLLSRLGVLHCASCGARLSVSANAAGAIYYRCHISNGDCPARVTISAGLAEKVVVDWVRGQTANLEGTGSIEQDSVQADREAEAAGDAYRAALRMLSGHEDEDEARLRLAELREDRDEKQAKADSLRGDTASYTASTLKNWEDMNLQERRAIIRVFFRTRKATVAPGRGADRITFVDA